MATTPNFNWSTPDNTGLVKNGALDIRTLGDAIDASMADLKGGTTNQVLAKNSNTDMDFKWVADASGIPATIIDAKGDLIAGTAADTAARLAVGTNGQVLTADSTAATGLAWASAGAPTYTWATYTPSNIGITVGNGTQTARFVKVGKTVFVSYRFVLGSTSSVSGGVYVGMPSNSNSYSTCPVQVTDSGTGNYVCQGALDPGGGQVLIRPVKTNATYGTWDDSLGSLITYAANDDIKFFITYEEA
jgi:hypothetical protein